MIILQLFGIMYLNFARYQHLLEDVPRYTYIAFSFFHPPTYLSQIHFFYRAFLDNLKYHRCFSRIENGNSSIVTSHAVPVYTEKENKNSLVLHVYRSDRVYSAYSVDDNGHYLRRFNSYNRMRRWCIFVCTKESVTGKFREVVALFSTRLCHRQ